MKTSFWINGLLWTGAVAVLAWGIWHHSQTMPLPEAFDPTLRLIERHREAQEATPLVEAKQFAHVGTTPWVRIKPPPPKPVAVGDTGPQHPFLLTRVINDHLVELQSVKHKGKKIYRVGEDITERDLTDPRHRLVVGRVVSLDRTEDEDLLTIIYQDKKFILKLETGEGMAAVHLEKNLGKFKLTVSDPNNLLPHEGREIGPNSFELHADFLNAMLENAAQEVGKIRYAQDPQGNFLITELAPDSVLRKFGFQERDVLLAFNGQRLKNLTEITKATQLWKSSRSKQSQIRVMRSGKAVDIKFLINQKSLGKFKEHFQ